MPDSPLIDREVSALKTLEQISAERARAEIDVEQSFTARRLAEDKAYKEASEKLKTTWKAESTAIQARYASVKDGILKQFTTEYQTIDSEYSEVKRRVSSKANTVKKAAKKAQEDARWNAVAVFEAAKDGAIKQYKQTEAEINIEAEQFKILSEDAEPILELCLKYAPAIPDPAAAAATSLAPATEPPAAAPVSETPAAVPEGETAAAAPEGETDAPSVPASDDPFVAYQEHIKRGEEQLIPLAKLGLPRFLRPGQFVAPFLALAFGLAVGLGLVLGWIAGPIVGGVVGIGLAIGIRIWLTGVAKKQVARLYPPFAQTMAEAVVLEKRARDTAKARFEQQKIDVEQRREATTKAADERSQKTAAEAEAVREKETKAADEKYPPQLNEVEQRRDEGLKQADDRYPRRLAEMKQKFEADFKAVEEAYREKKTTTQREYDETWARIIAQWRDGLGSVGATVDEVNSECAGYFLDWHNADLDQWIPPKAVPPALRFGAFEIDLSQIPKGPPVDERLRAIGPTNFNLPSIIPFPVQGSILIKMAESGRAPSNDLLQAVMLRYLTSIPAGKVRFTIIDPVGLGENFAAFMHLSDYSEMLVNSRIWTETSHIEQRLADISAHMETVIQKYLRNEFETIEAYNAHAGEVAEPFRVVVVANFPAGFSEAAARRLASIASSGARCGVYTLLSVDTKLPLPTGLQLKDLEPFCVNINWKEGRLQWRDDHFTRFPLKFDTPPDQSRFSQILHKVGDHARNANKVEVPFEFIAPKPEDYWTFDSRTGVDVPLGRAGATKLQHLKLGKGTSQHVLIAGKTGSGKSTLLHALITNAALRYSPEQMEMYLIDFKKGVEFKVYAALQLPHARVIAVESEREFGLSVLQRLDEELKTRGDMFRDLGVQDLNGYRQLEGQKPLPRVLFIVDEFQEFFVEDDKIAQEVSLLLDRLVRQGRAFGIHVHLGSQTLSGSFSLPRSTLGQMAVRIALQCSEADAHMILSEDNSAARLLTRPGEAIYNDQNGMVEGNNFFQVVLLSDSKREDYLRQIQALAIARNRLPTQQIVFEGNLPAVPSQNHLLSAKLLAPAWPAEAPLAVHAWLGDAIAIKDPTEAVFRSQSGSNLLIVGQNDEGTLGMMATSMIGLAAQHNPNIPAASASFYLLDGSPADSPYAGFLARYAEVLPHPVNNITTRNLAASMTEIAAEVERRQKSEGGDAGAIYLFVFDLQRFRDLRKQDDDYGYSSRFGGGEEKAVHPSKNFATILREGPPVGVHTFIWCDSINNLNRTFDRQGLREFEMRVLFQMSANDSSTLIDTPAASKLGEQRGLYFSEEEGRIEKFRPYGLPTDEWLAFVHDHFHGRPLPNGNGAAQSTPEAVKQEG